MQKPAQEIPAPAFFIIELETRCCQRTPPDAEAFMSQEKRM